MKLLYRLSNWLETHWVTPSYAGLVLVGIALSFFGAATNTMVGWLYAISGLVIALMILAGFLCWRSLRGVEITRRPLLPVSAGDELRVELTIINHLRKPQTLFQAKDMLPYVLSPPVEESVELIPAQGKQSWVYLLVPEKRGVYRWHEVELRTGNPLGLFWCRRSQKVEAKAIVYPRVLPLKTCPLLDTIGQDQSTQFNSDRHFQAATEGITRSLRPYRLGDPTRLIHWRSSAKYGDLKVRELEVITGGQEVIIALDSGVEWEEEEFEKAVIAAASLYFYALHRQLQVQLWTASSGVIHGSKQVLEVLAAIYPQEEVRHPLPTSLPLVWLTPHGNSLNSLPTGSRWLLFSPLESVSGKESLAGLTISKDLALQAQLQKSLRR